MDKEPVYPACKTPLQLIYRRSRSQNGKTYKPKNASCFRMLICPACSPQRENTQNVQIHPAGNPAGRYCYIIVPSVPG